MDSERRHWFPMHHKDQQHNTAAHIGERLKGNVEKDILEQATASETKKAWTRFYFTETCSALCVLHHWLHDNSSLMHFCWILSLYIDSLISEYGIFIPRVAQPRLTARLQRCKGWYFGHIFSAEAHFLWLWCSIGNWTGVGCKDAE